MGDWNYLRGFSHVFVELLFWQRCRILVWGRSGATGVTAPGPNSFGKESLAALERIRAQKCRGLELVLAPRSYA